MCELDIASHASLVSYEMSPPKHDKERLSVCSHFSWLDDDEVLIRKGPCQINLKKTPTKSLPLRWMTRQLSGLTLEKKWNQTFCCGDGGNVLNTATDSKCQMSQKSPDYVSWIITWRGSVKSRAIMTADWHELISSM